jgi:alkanesulfonate monooxygenase SsuD/methylene tetrahydromethanopterin reductase-like flavin-dependent oxidoreductase (luciferase family)
VQGLGAGDDGSDAQVLGAPPLTPRERASRFAEFVETLDGLLTTDGFAVEGEHAWDAARGAARRRVTAGRAAELGFTDLIVRWPSDRAQERIAAAA